MTSSSSTALLLVDPYNDFVADDGSLWPLVSEVAQRVQLREHLQSLLTAARDADLTVAYAPHRRWRPGDVEDWQRPGPVHARLRDRHYYAAGTAAGEWYPPLAPREDDVVAAEHWGMSGFASTDLDLRLRQRGVDHLLLAGLTATGCVEGTGRWAMELGYAVTLVGDAVASFDDAHQHAAVSLTGPLYAREVVTTTDAIAIMG